MILHMRKKDTLVVRLTDDLDHNCAERVRHEIDELLEDPRVKRLVFDLTGLGFMDSSGIGVILGRYRTLSKRPGGSVAVQNPSPHVDRIFSMSGLYQVVERIQQTQGGKSAI